MINKDVAPNPASNNPNNPKSDDAPVDPSNTSSIGQKVEQGVISTQRGISEQSPEWEDAQERSIPSTNGSNSREESYLKNPSPEEINIDKEQ